MSIGWGEREAVHLLNRAAFFAGKREVEASLALGRDETVRRLVAGESLTDTAEELLPFEQVLCDGKPLDSSKINDQETYWLYRMARTEAPLKEKMALFWHGHFATSYQKVRSIPFMIGQIGMFRDRGMGPFRDLVLAVGKDPAMLIWLDSNSNKKGKPNENYAREVMELFTLGIGNYTETDIKEAARAFTGWQVDKDSGEVKFNAKQHDTGTKTVLGRSGNLDETGVVAALFDQKALPVFMAKKLLRFFAADEPPQDWIDELADVFAAKETVGDVLAALFVSDRFYAEENRGALIKTPAEYVAGIIKALDLPLSAGYAAAMRRMGQQLYLPPDVAGWRGGTAWLATTQLLARCQFAETASRRLKGTVLDGSDFTPREKTEASAWVTHWGQRLGLWSLGEKTVKALSAYAGDTFLHSKEKQAGQRGLLQLLLASPEAQMK